MKIIFEILFKSGVEKTYEQKVSDSDLITIGQENLKDGVGQIRNYVEKSYKNETGEAILALENGNRVIRLDDTSMITITIEE